MAAIRLHDLDLKEEKVLVSNDGAATIDLTGMFVQDLECKNTSRPFENITLAPHSSKTLWTCPGKHGIFDDDDKNILWRNKNGKPRSKTVLNDDGDCIKLMSADGEVIASVSKSGGNENEEVQLGTCDVPQTDQSDDADEIASEKESDQSDTCIEEKNETKDPDIDELSSVDPTEEDELDALVEQSLNSAKISLGLDDDNIPGVLSSSLQARSGQTYMQQTSIGGKKGSKIKLTKLKGSAATVPQPSAAQLEKGACAPAFSKSLKQKLRELREARSRTETTGRKWFDMKSSELTPELAVQLKLLNMRHVLDRKRFYKSSDNKRTPKFFQVGRIVDGPADFYSDRSSKKEAKKSLVDELLSDVDKRRYNKRKYQELTADKYQHNRAKRAAKPKQKQTKSVFKRK